MSDYRPTDSDVPDILRSGGRILAGAAGAAGSAVRTYLKATAWSYRRGAEVLDEGARMLEAVTGEAVEVPAPPDPTTDPHRAEARRASASSPAESSIAELYEQAFASSADTGAQNLFRSLLENMVPDEAIVFSAVASGEAIAVVRIEPRLPTGTEAGPITVATLAGDKCAISSPRLASAYVARLRSLDLIEIGPEDGALKTDYEVLIARADVREAQSSPLRTRTIKGTLRPTDLGRQLWDACNPGGTA